MKLPLLFTLYSILFIENPNFSFLLIKYQKAGLLSSKRNSLFHHICTFIQMELTEINERACVKYDDAWNIIIPF